MLGLAHLVVNVLRTLVAFATKVRIFVENSVAQIIHANCLTWLRASVERFRLIFGDPPDNIGLNYRGYHDSNPDYYSFLREWIDLSFQKCDIFAISYYHKHDLVVSRLISDAMTSIWSERCLWRKIIWRFTFGSYVHEGLTSGYRPIMVVWKHGITFDYDAIRVPSVRMEIGDSRAAGPRIPDDVWDFPRVVGNAAERRTWHPTQHPELLMQRLLKMCGPYPTGIDSHLKSGETHASHVLDCFSGTGTTCRVAQSLGIECIGLEIDAEYVRQSQEDLKNSYAQAMQRLK